jgi:hypothetical protein
LDPLTTAFGSNSDGAFDAIATFYCRKTDKPRTPSNVVSHDVVFPTTTFSSVLRRYMTPRVIINWIVQPHIDVVRPTFQTWQETFQNVASETLKTWQDRRFKRGKTDVQTWQVNVASETLQTWQVRRCKRGK